MINKAEETYLERSEMRCWRRTLRVSWIEFRSNDSVRFNGIGEPRGLLRSVKEKI